MKADLHGSGKFRKTTGFVQLRVSTAAPPSPRDTRLLRPEELSGAFDCQIEGLDDDCTVDTRGFLIVAPSAAQSLPQPAAARAPKPGERLAFTGDPEITFTVTDGALTLKPRERLTLNNLRDPSPSPTASPSATPSPEPTQTPPETTPPKPAPTDTSRPPRKPRPTEPPRPTEEPTATTAPPRSGPNDPNSGNGRRQPRVPGQAGDDWAPSGDSSSDGAEYNYGDPVPRAPGTDDDAREDVISADGHNPHSHESDPSRDNADADEATDMASAAGSAWAISGLIGIAAISLALVLFVLGRNRRRKN